jgi:hypothetical protein
MTFSEREAQAIQDKQSHLHARKVTQIADFSTNTPEMESLVLCCHQTGGTTAAMLLTVGPV